MSLNASSFLGDKVSLKRGAETALELSLLRNVHHHIRKGKMAGLSRSKRRKITNRRKRWFTDNIVMHHKRLHDRSRQQAIEDVRKKALERRKQLKKKKQPTLKEALKIENKGELTWDQKINMKDRSIKSRERIKNRELRAQSRWLSVNGASGDKKDENA